MAGGLVWIYRWGWVAREGRGCWGALKDWMVGRDWGLMIMGGFVCQDEGGGFAAYAG